MCKDAYTADVEADWAFFDMDETKFWFHTKVSEDPELLNRFTEKNGPATTQDHRCAVWKFEGLGTVRIEKQGPGEFWLITVTDQQ